MAAAAPVSSLEGVDPSPGKVSFKETTEVIEVTWGPGATNPNTALYTSAMMQAVQQYQVGKEEREKASRRRALFTPDGGAGGGQPAQLHQQDMDQQDMHQQDQHQQPQPQPQPGQLGQENNVRKPAPTGSRAGHAYARWPRDAP